MADIIPFPLDRRAALVREIADRMETLHGPAANIYWREHIARIVAGMRATGFADDAIRAEILHLQHAVQMRLRGQAASHGGQ